MKNKRVILENKMVVQVLGCGLENKLAELKNKRGASDNKMRSLKIKKAF